MGFVKSTGRVDGEVAFEIEQAEEKALIESEAEPFQCGEIDFLFGRFFARLQPHDVIAADVFADFQTGSATDTGRAEVAFFKCGLAFVFQTQGIGGIKAAG